jgi:hypothetical protein
VERVFLDVHADHGDLDAEVLGHSLTIPFQSLAVVLWQPFAVFAYQSEQALDARVTFDQLAGLAGCSPTVPGNRNTCLDKVRL